MGNARDAGNGVRYARDAGSAGIKHAGDGSTRPGLSIPAFCARAELPDFDLIVLQQPWSCLPPSVQVIVVDFVRRKLRAGGVFAVRYHCLPGWAPMAPVRSLLAHVAGEPNAMIDHARDFADSLLATGSAYFDAYPHVAANVQALRDSQRSALARGYASDCLPLGFAAMADLLGQAKLTFACPADVLDHVDALHFTAPQRALLAELTDPVLSQSVRDLMCNRSWRADYWVKGARTLSPLHKREAMQQLPVVMAALPGPGEPHASPPAATPELPGRATAVTSHKTMEAPLLALMSDRQPRTIGELAARWQAGSPAGLPAGSATCLQTVFEAVMVLVGTGKLTVATPAHGDGVGDDKIDGGAYSASNSA